MGAGGCRLERLSKATACPVEEQVCFVNACVRGEDDGVVSVACFVGGIFDRNPRRGCCFFLLPHEGTI